MDSKFVFTSIFKDHDEMYLQFNPHQYDKKYRTLGSSKVLEAAFVDCLQELYTNFFDRNWDDLERTFINLISICCFQQKHRIPDLMTRAREQYTTKNVSRGANWSFVGALGQMSQIHTKVGRILSEIQIGQDSSEDSWVDLYNYAVFGFICCKNGNYMPLYYRGTQWPQSVYLQE